MPEILIPASRNRLGCIDGLANPMEPATIARTPDHPAQREF
jgi:hypothetical protein